MDPHDASKNSSLRSRVARGGAWSGLGSGLERSARFVRNVLLARLLAPDAFGIMAIVISINALFEAFTEVGIRRAVVQHPEADQDTYLNGAWWFSFFRSLTLYAAAFLCAPYVARFYEKEQLVPLMRVAFVGMVCFGTISPKSYLALKRMRFRKWTLVYNGGAILGLVGAIVLGFALRNVWALVIGFTAENVARWFLSYILCPFFPRFKFNRNHNRALLRYASGTFGTPILYFLFMRADIFVIGKVMKAEQLGLYSMAAHLARMPLQFIGSLFSEVLLPALSHVQDDRERFNRVLMHAVSVVLYGGFPALAFAVFFGKDVLHVVYGEKYAAVATPFSIIFAVEMLKVSSAPMAAAFMSVGKPEQQRLFMLVRALLLLTLVYPMVKFYGLPGAALSALIAMAVALHVQIKRINAMSGLPVPAYYAVLFRASFTAIFVFVSWVPAHLALESYVSRLVVGTFACGFSYAFALWRFPDLRRAIRVPSVSRRLASIPGGERLLRWAAQW